ncbi:DNA topoisomerase IB [Wenyingzhuangia sp. IMCC45533]
MDLKKYSEPSFITKMIQEPNDVIHHFDLKYTTSKDLSIERVKKGKEFVYKYNHQIIDNQKLVDRIDQLVIPPAWEKVKIAYPINGHLQAVGRDIKNRKQYRYHPLWNKIRNQTKFFKLSSFGKKLPKIRAKISKDLEDATWSKSKVLALVVKLMEETHIRIGGAQYAKRNRTYGLTTLRNKHVFLNDKKMRFEFIGKKGKQHRISVKNKKLVKLVRQCEELPGWELFQYFDVDGNKCSIDSTMVNDYIQTISGDLYSAKDFRTWAGSVLFFEALHSMGTELDNEKNQKNILAAFDIVASELGNTRNVCRKYYVHPVLIHQYKNHGLAPYFAKIDKSTSANEGLYFSIYEKTMLEILDNYIPEFLALDEGNK